MRCVALVLALAACGEDPSLRVSVDFERPPIHRVVVSVYESPSLTCEQVEYADLTEAQLAALLVDEQTITGDAVEGSLDNLSRTNHKLIVARGYAETGELLEGGCAEHDLVVEDDRLTIHTHVIADVSAQVAIDDVTGLPVEPLRIALIATDRDGVPLADRPAAWRMIGPAGSDPTQATNIASTGDGTWQPEAPACTGATGTASVYPVTPNLVGGFASTVRVAWANQVATQFSGITNTSLGLTDLVIPDETRHPCAVSVKRSGTALVKRLVCVDGSFAREYPVTVSGGAATLGTPASVSLARPPIGLFAVPADGDALEREVYALDKDGKVTALFGASPAQPTVNCPECANSVVDALVAPACGTRDADKMILVIRGGLRDTVKVMPPRGGLAVEVRGVADAEPNLEIGLRAAGCVTTIDPAGTGYEERQLTVMDLATLVATTTRGFYACNGSSCKRVVLPVAEAAVGFTRTSPPYLIGTATDATGIVLATWGLVPDPMNPTTDQLVERAPRIASGALPGHVATGTFDEDDGPDMIWDLVRNRGAAIELAYSSAAGIRLQAVSTPIPLSVIDVLATDVTQDDHDDIIVVARKPLLGGAGVLVVPTHAVAPPRSIPVTTCGS